MRRLFANANYDFLSARRITLPISAVAILLIALAAAFFQVRSGTWLNYGVDFTGGSIIQFRIAGESVSEAQVRAVATAAAPGATVSAFGDENEFRVRMPSTGTDAATQSSQAVMQALRAQFGEQNVELESEDSVGAKVGSELQSRALIAILVSFAATLIYLAIRFEWRFGVAAVIATLHDILLTIGFLLLLRLEVSLPTVAAVLTILGYSLNDTIVIFDRIRENLKTAKRQEFLAVLNRSINDTLPRTVLTTATTLVTLLSLYLFGGVIIREFALILIVGILLGTYSSIFIAAPALLEIEKRFPHEQKHARRPRAAAPRPTRV
ncbi:MAG TPA: protein translocase subunit SecF [Longimicrobiales bacterium]